MQYNTIQQYNTNHVLETGFFAKWYSYVTFIFIVPKRFYERLRVSSRRTWHATCYQMIVLFLPDKEARVRRHLFKTFEYISAYCAFFKPYSVHPSLDYCAECFCCCGGGVVVQVRSILSQRDQQPAESEWWQHGLLHQSWTAHSSIHSTPLLWLPRCYCQKQRGWASNILITPTTKKTFGDELQTGWFILAIRATVCVFCKPFWHTLL